MELFHSQIKLIVNLAKIDSAVFILNVKLKNSRKKVDDYKLILDKIAQEKSKIEFLLNDKKNKYSKAEKFLKEENEKLIARRKALSTFNNYKVQQSASKEIDNSAKELQTYEDGMLNILQEIEEAQERLNKINLEFEENRLLYNKQVTVFNEEYEEVQSFISRKSPERVTYSNQIEEKNLNEYERIRSKFGVDPVVQIVNGACGGCNMTLSPKVVNDTLSEKSLMNCPGCRRILYHENVPKSD